MLREHYYVWMNEWMKDAELTDILDLQERVQTIMLFQFFLDEGSAEVNSILKEIYLSKVDVEKETDDCANHKATMFRLLFISNIFVYELSKILSLLLIAQ